MTARPKSWLGQSATSSTRANACAFFVLPDAARQQKNSDHSPQSAQSSQRGGERGSYFFKNSLSLGLFLCVLCDLRGEFSEKFSHVQQISTISTRRFNHKFNYFLCFCALKIIAAIEYPPVIVKILSHLGLPTRAPARRVDLFQTIGEAQTAERPKPMETLALSASKR